MQEDRFNPFFVSGYLSPAYFCDRKDETEQVVSALNNNRNITLFSPRRYGKTGLIHHILNHLQKKERYEVIYLDILGTESHEAFLNELANAVLKQVISKNKGFIEKAVDILKNLRPRIGFDELTGKPTVDITVSSEKDATKSLDSILGYLEGLGRPIAIAIDEFQQICYYENKNTEAILRANIQQLKNVRFIFSGSQKHMLLAMFGSSKRPFYQSAQLLQLDEIDNKIYAQFIARKFKNGAKNIEQEAVDFILEWTWRHTWYTQFLCNRLYSKNIQSIDLETAEQTVNEILNENEAQFYNYRSLLTKPQWKLLSAIAKQKEAVALVSKDFLGKYGLGAASTVKRSLEVLLRTEMVYEHHITNAGKPVYRVYQVYLSRWLERQKYF